MKNILYAMCCFIFVIPSVTVGSDGGNKGRERAIYFCHRDAEFSPDIFLKEKRDSEDDLSNSTFRNISSSLARPVYYARHCFFMIANKEREYEQQNKTLVSLDEIETVGYGKIGRIAKGVGQGGESIEYLRVKPIACIPIVKDNEDDIKLVEQQLGSEYYGKVPNLNKVWLVILNLAHKHSKPEYNFCDGNCCTFAYDIVEQLIGKDKALTTIEPSSFNGGIGITNGQCVGFFADKAMSIVRYTKQHLYGLGMGVTAVAIGTGGWIVFKRFGYKKK
jgi:hypothetical protein